MILVDSALRQREAEERPIRVGIVGAGYMGRAIAAQLARPLPGIRLVAIANRTLATARLAFTRTGAQPPEIAPDEAAVDRAIDQMRPVITDDHRALCQAEGIDIVIEVTGDVEFGAHVAVDTIAAGKHLILVNAELDATLGPVLKQRADRAGVVITNTDGDEPGVALNLFRFVQTLGLEPVMAGNIKGFYDRYRNPETQREFAAKVGQNVRQITSYADGSKLSMECAVLANATGFGVDRRGMNGFACEHVNEVLERVSPEDLLSRPVIDFTVGAAPGSGAFVVGYRDDPHTRESLRHFKMGDGPLYLFYTPFHLPQLQVAVTIGRAALFADACVTPRGAPVCDAVTCAKRDLRAGEKLDGIGGFACYGLIESAEIARRENLLPLGLSADCRLRRDLPRDAALTYDDVEIPEGRLSDELRREQELWVEHQEG